MTNNQKIMLYIGIAAVFSVGLILIYKAYKKKAADAVNDIQQKDIVLRPDGTPVPVIPQWVIDKGIAQRDAQLAAKRALFEAQWKIVAILILTLSYAILFSIIFWDFSSDQKDIYFTIAGGVTAIVTMIVSYYFGSSKNPNDENPIK